MPEGTSVYEYVWKKISMGYYTDVGAKIYQSLNIKEHTRWTENGYTYNQSGHTVNMASPFLFSMSIMDCHFRQITICKKNAQCG
jgi:hypothetical protein